MSWWRRLLCRWFGMLCDDKSPPSPAKEFKAWLTYD